MKKIVIAVIALLVATAAMPAGGDAQAEIAARAMCVDGKIVLQVATSGPGVWSIVLDGNPCARLRL